MSFLACVYVSIECLVVVVEGWEQKEGCPRTGVYRWLGTAIWVLGTE